MNSFLLLIDESFIIRTFLSSPIVHWKKKKRKKKRTNIDWLYDDLYVSFSIDLIYSMYKKQSRTNQHHYTRQQRITRKTSSQVG
jgi:hypothetical protein